MMMMESETFAPEELRRLNALANAATRRLHELLESETDTSPSQSRSPARNKRERNFMRSADDDDELEVEEEEYSDEKAIAANKRRKCSPNKNIISIPNIKNKKKAPRDDGPHPPPPLPEDFKKVIQQIAAQQGGGKSISDEILVIQKELYDTDLAKTQNRLSIPFSKVCDHKFLTDEEAQFLTRRDENHKMKFKEVTIIEPSLELEKVKLSRWDMNKGNGRNTSSHYVLNGTWWQIAQRNNLKPYMVVQIWSFRVDQQLHLALVKLP